MRLRVTINDIFLQQKAEFHEIIDVCEHWPVERGPLDVIVYYIKILEPSPPSMAAVRDAELAKFCDMKSRILHQSNCVCGACRPNRSSEQICPLSDSEPGGKDRSSPHLCSSPRSKG